LIPTFFYIAPNATNITTRQTNEIGRSPGVPSFPLNGVKLLHYWKRLGGIDVFDIHTSKVSIRVEMHYQTRWLN
jgi:hypothetical protein